ncbi:pro-resilin-like [Venturia canescens]|uniref:pro-resilin-like n=1 Tax=Venturia canescens TaxID=32260 RepID=UPI001C9C0290|nr:pro-resilin-like [Venturia canescens]
MLVAEAAIALTLFVVGISGRPEPPVSQQHQAYLPPDQQYGPPQRNGANSPAGQGYNAFGGASTYARPIQTAPSAPGSPYSTNQYLPPNQQYGAPGTGNRPYDDGSSNGPARYDFEYMVNDIASGNDFGHKESRDGDVTRGVYYVLLPDGRRQTVEYEADQNGFRPKVTYVQEGTGIGGPSGNNPGGYPAGNNGYRY